MAEVEWWDHEDIATMARELAGDLAFLIDRAIEANGWSRVALPGGPDLAGPLSVLAAQSLPWRKLTILPTDDDQEGTRAAALAALFVGLGAGVEGLDGIDPRALPLDVVWLSPGPSGQVAGMTPGPGLAAALSTPHAVIESGLGPGLSGSAIRCARAIVITLFDEESRKQVERAIAEGAGSRLPIGRLLADCEQAIDIHCLSQGGE